MAINATLLQSLREELLGYLTDPDGKIFGKHIEAAYEYASSVCFLSLKESKSLPTVVKTFTVVVSDGVIQLPTPDTIIKLLNVKSSNGTCINFTEVAPSMLNTGLPTCGKNTTFNYSPAGTDAFAVSCGVEDGTQLKVTALLQPDEPDDEYKKKLFTQYKAVIIDFMLSYLYGIEQESRISVNLSNDHFTKATKLLEQIVVGRKASKLTFGGNQDG